MTLPRLSSRPPGAGQYTSAGQYNKWVTFNNPANPSAGTLENPSFSAWANIRGLTVTEQNRAQQLEQRASHLVTVPYQGGISNSMTITLNESDLARTFQIVDVLDPDERRVELRITCYEIGQNAGGASTAMP